MKRQSHGTGEWKPESFKRFGTGIVIEHGVLVFHPENIEIGNDVYVGHDTILKGYYKNGMVIGEGTWIGQQAFFHSAGGIYIGKNVGIGPKVAILTSQHAAAERAIPVLHSPLTFAPVRLEDGCDVGVASVVLPGVVVGQGAIIGAGAVVTRSIPPFEVWAGVPARKIGER